MGKKLQSEFSTEGQLWPTLKLHLDVGDLSWMVARLQDFAQSTPHEHYAGLGPVYIFDQHEGRVAYWLADQWSRQALGDSGLLVDHKDPETQKYSNLLFRSLMSHEPKARVDIVRSEIKDLVTVTVGARREYMGPSDLEILIKAMKQAEEDIPNLNQSFKDTLARLYQAADSLPEIEMTDTEVRLSEAADAIRHCGDYGKLFFHLENKKVCWVAADSDCDPERGLTTISEIEELLSVDGVESVEVVDEGNPIPSGSADGGGWVVVPHNAQVADLSLTE